MEALVYVLSTLAIVVTGVDLWLAFQLKEAIGRGDMAKGEVGRK
jgi:hypothetical protein